MAHILVTYLGKCGTKAEKTLVNSDHIVYVNSDTNDRPYYWLNMSTPECMISWRIKESPEEVDALIESKENLSYKD